MHARGNNLYMCVGKAVMLLWGLLRLAPIRSCHALQPLSGYPGCRQAEGTVVRRSLFWYQRLIAQATSAQIIPYNWLPSEHLWGVTTTTLQTYLAFVVTHLSQLLSGYCIFQDCVVIACPLVQAGVTSGYDHGCKVVWEKLPLWLPNVISMYPVCLLLGCNQGNHSVVKTNFFFFFFFFFAVACMSPFGLSTQHQGRYHAHILHAHVSGHVTSAPMI